LTPQFFPALRKQWPPVLNAGGFALKPILGKRLGTHRFQRADMAVNHLEPKWAHRDACTLEAMRTQALFIVSACPNAS
jgi:hypothetical protein